MHEHNMARIHKGVGPNLDMNVFKETMEWGNLQELLNDVVLDDGNMCHAASCRAKQEAWMAIDRL